MPKYYTVNDFTCRLGPQQKLMEDPVYAHDMEHVFDRQNLLNALEENDCCPDCGKSVNPEALQSAELIRIAIDVYRKEKRLITDAQATLIKESNTLVSDIAELLDIISDSPSSSAAPTSKANILFAHNLTASDTTILSIATPEQLMRQSQHQIEHGFLDTAQEELSTLTEQAKEKSKLKRF